MFVKTIILAAVFSISAYWQGTGSGTMTGKGRMDIRVLSASSTMTFPTTLTAESAFNGSACGSPLPAWCNSAFPGWTDNYALSSNPPSAPIITNPYNPAPFRIAKGRGTKGDLHKLTTNPAKIIAHFVGWFQAPQTSSFSRDGVTYGKANSHMVVGHTNHDPAFNDAVINDLWERGIDGAMLLWSGDPNGCGYPNWTSTCSGTKINKDAAMAEMMDSIINLHPSMSMSLIYSTTAVNQSGSCAASDLTGSNFVKQPACVESKLRHDLAYAKFNYFSQTQYLKHTNGRPIVFFFFPTNTFSFSQCTTSTPCTTVSSGNCTSNSTCMAAIFNGLSNYMATTQSTPIEMIFQDETGFTRPSSGGSFLWTKSGGVDGSAITTATQLNWGSTSYANWYSSSATNASKIGVAAVKKGVDFHNADWWYPLGRVNSQQCGQVWLATFALANGKTSPGQVDYFQIVTWDDYEEGTEVETGIDNCYSTPTLSLSGLDLTVTLHPTNTTYSGTAVQNSALQDFDIFASLNGTDIEQIGTASIPTTTLTKVIDLSTFPQLESGITYTMFIRQNGKPSTKTLMSSGIAVTR